MMTIAKGLLAAVGLSLAFLAVDSPAQAQPPACRTDIDKLCPDVEKGQGRILKCLKEHSDELSADCKAALEKRRQSAQQKQQGAQKKKERQQRQAARRQRPRDDGQWRKVCGADVDKYCSEARGKPDAMITCLRENQKDFSADCQTMVADVLKKIDERKAAKKKD